MTLRVGRYEALRAIASGGMATVYLGRAVGAGGFERLVALKIMHPHIAAEPEFVAMFLDEARLAARVRHPNVVATIDLVEDPLFLVMEYIEGPSLHLLLRTCAKARRPFPLGIALRIFLDMLAGLHAAHELTGPNGEPLNLVHRDISPQNVLVGVDGVSRITDFGVARAESRLTSTRGTTLKGKLGYMAPEQIRAEQVDRRSDVYAAGVVLWEMLTEQRLFKAENDGALIAQILDGPRNGPRSIVPTVPAAIDRVCLCALRAGPDERFPTAAALAEAIEQAVAHTPGLTIASSRAVAALIKELSLHAQPEHLTGPAMALGGGPSSSSAPRSRPAPISQQTPNLIPPSVPSAAFEAASATAIGALVSDEPNPFRPNVVRRGLVAGVAVVAVSLAAAGLFAVGQGTGAHDDAGAGSASSSTPVSAAAEPARSGEHPEIPDLAAPDASAESEAAVPPSASASTDDDERTPGGTTRRKSKPAARGSIGQGGRPKPVELDERGASERTPPAPYRPTEL